MKKKEEEEREQKMEQGGEEGESKFLVMNEQSLPQSQLSLRTQFDSLPCLFPWLDTPFLVLISQNLIPMTQPESTHN